MSGELTAARTPGRPDFGRHVRLCRRARGLTQEALAERSALSIDTIRRLERGCFSPSLTTLQKLCHGLDLQVSTLFASFEQGVHATPRELVDAIATMNPAAQKALLQFFAALRVQPDQN